MAYPIELVSRRGDLNPKEDEILGQAGGTLSVGRTRSNRTSFPSFSLTLQTVEFGVCPPSEKLYRAIWFIIIEYFILGIGVGYAD